ncbi:PP2C family serine/threonine-protein phosphatase [Mesoflavibacter zeaxanthinifaciens]|jgi:serine/threonine protein phosphatase PrpC|uniref:PP2C family serine/threonine-protein phosphatase n=1 Tax=Mesoflavibacter zeaxanthinifaciens TaxID=393060 RepID=UPI003A8F8D74
MKDKDELYQNSVIATGTTTNKSENQDCKGEFECENFNAMFIADGLGSFKYAKQSSERVIDFFKTQASELKDNAGENPKPKFIKVFKQAKEKLIDFANENLNEEDKNEQNLFGTTAITVFETDEKIIVAYVGNGAIWHIRGNFSEFPEAYLYPWNAVNYLNPHTAPESGKEALYRLISNSDDFSECVPTIFEIGKDKSVGDIFMICTDGIYSADQLKVGKNDKGVWVRYEQTMLKFFEYLKQFFKNNQLYNKESVKQIINLYLEDLKPTFDDDATIGILATTEALNYQNQINWLIKDENNSGNTI